MKSKTFINPLKIKQYPVKLIKQAFNTYTKVLQKHTLSANIKNAEYAVRGKIPLRGEEIMNEIKSGKGSNHNFSSTTALNIGNPQALGQGHLTFNREVLSCLLNPLLITQNNEGISLDARARASLYQKVLISPMGAYTPNSKGFEYVRVKVAEFINKRDNLQNSLANPKDIYLTNGAGEGVKLVLNMLIRGENDGIMIPIPQYPLYSALITLMGGRQINYYLDETKNWNLDINDVKKKISDSVKAGIIIRSIVIINPGNPTGQVLSKTNIEEIIDICYKNNILIIADEVYQNNIYKKGSEFISFRKVLNEMPAKIRDSLELISVNSISKGITGECGLRGGYMETHNLDEFAGEQIYKLKSIELCANTVGQAATLLLVDPPKKGVESDLTVNQFEKEKKFIFEGLKTRAEILYNTLTSMENVSCTEIEGAMYAFPRVHFSDKALNSAKNLRVSPDFLYCNEMVNDTGIMTVPGSGFGQREGEYHFRITNLVCPTERMKDTMESLKNFNAKFHDKYKL